MTSYLDKLNLRPQERRLVVFVAVVVFVVVNLIWVVPQFGQVGIWEQRKKDSEDKLRKYTNEIGRIRAYSNELTTLQNQGVTIGNDDPTLSLQRDVSSLASANSVQIDLISPVQRVARTNSMFEEAGMRITVIAGEKELVEFLYNLGARNTLIRVRTMSLQPDQSQTRLRGTLEFVQSFLKKPVKAPPPGGPGTKTPKPPSGALAKANTPAPASSNVVAAQKIKAPATAPPSTNWFTKIVARITGGSSAKPAKTNATAKPKAAAPAKTNLRTNAPPGIPAPSAPR